MSAGGRKVRKTVLSALRKAVSGMGEKCRVKEGRNRRGNVRSGRRAGNGGFLSLIFHFRLPSE